MQIKLEFITGKDEKGEEITEIRTFTNNKIKSRMLRDAIELSDKIDFSNLKGTDMDALVDFNCGIYKNAFTRDEFYDGLPANLMIDVLVNMVEDIVNGAVDRLGTFPEE